MAPSYGGKLRLPSQNPIANLIETKAGHTWAESLGPGSFPRGDGRRRAPGTGAAPSPPPSRGRAGAPGTRPSTAEGSRRDAGRWGLGRGRAEPSRAGLGWVGHGRQPRPGKEPPAPLGTLRRRKKKAKARLVPVHQEVWGLWEGRLAKGLVSCLDSDQEHLFLGTASLPLPNRSGTVRAATWQRSCGLKSRAEVTPDPRVLWSAQV